MNFTSRAHNIVMVSSMAKWSFILVFCKRPSCLQPLSKNFKLFNFFFLIQRGGILGGMGATGKGIKVMSGIFVEGGYWRVRGWTKTASAERMYHATFRFKNYACEMGAFFVTNCPRRQDCLIWGWNKDLLHILLVH